MSYLLMSILLFTIYKLYRIVLKKGAKFPTIDYL